MQTRKPISIDLLKAYERSDAKPAGWNTNDAERALLRYEKFLLLAAKYKHLPHAPTQDIDVMWHLHMLQPVAYYQDCMALFGEIFDHDGGFGKGVGESTVLQQVFANTSTLWERDYQEAYVTTGTTNPVNCWHDCQGRCWHACKSKLTHLTSASLQ